MNTNKPYFNIGELEYTPDYHKKIFNQIWALRPKDDQYIKFMGKDVKLPRRIKAYGYDYKGFLGSDKTNTEWEIPEIIKEIQEYTGKQNYYNSILINFYDGPNDYIGKHHDSDEQLGKKYSIYTFSIFENEKDFRIMRFTNPKDKTDKKDITIKNFMSVGFNKEANKRYKHEILKSKKSNKNYGRRISITFRRIKEDWELIEDDL